MFNWFYWTINLGALSSLITTNIEKYHSFWLAYLIPTLVFLFTLLVLLRGRRLYLSKPASGSLLIRAARIIVTAIRLRIRLGRQTDKAHLLDYAKQNESTDHNQFVDDLKQALGACRVFAFYPFYWVCYNQMNNNMISQAAQMNVGKANRASFIIDTSFI
jgi:proton-dependent oligopeptide transporter, POT family